MRALCVLGGDRGVAALDGVGAMLNLGDSERIADRLEHLSVNSGAKRLEAQNTLGVQHIQRLSFRMQQCRRHRMLNRCAE